MVLFTKPDCGKCDVIKDEFDLPSLGIEEARLGPDNSRALADLAWYELVDEAEKTLPILVTDQQESLVGALRIRGYLRSLDQPEEAQTA